MHLQEKGHPVSQSSQTPEATAFVAMVGTIPLAVANDLAVAQDDLMTRQARYGSTADYDYRWDEYEPGKVWRLMQRSKQRKGRFSWTTYSVHATELLGGAR